MFCTCPNCKGKLLTVSKDRFNMMRCDCKVGWVDEHEIKKEKFKSDVEIMEEELDERFFNG